MIVGANEPSRDELSRRLRQHGYLVSTAAEGREAVTLAESVAYDLVLLDADTPGLSGVDVLTRLRALRSDVDLPVIMLTAEMHGERVVEAIGLGANDYVTKPIDIPIALARIATQLSRKWATVGLRVSEERYALAMRGSHDGLWDWNVATNEVHWSPRWKAMLGHEPWELSNGPEEWLDRVHPEDVERVRQSLTANLRGAGDHYESEHRLLHRNGTFRWVLCRGAAVRNSNGVATRLAGSFSDVTEAKLADPLTGLPNRLLFLDLLERAIKRTGRRRTSTYALLVLGLDRFTAVNDSLGPLTADRLLVAVAHRLQSSLRATDVVAHQDAFTLARLGGDEFNVLLDDIADASDAVRVAERLRLALQEPFELDGQHVFTSASVGIAVGTTGYERADDVLRDAGVALHRVKSDRTAACEIFDPAMRTHAVSRLQVETDLRRAIEGRAFEPYYQPIVSLRTGRIAGFEALVRWRHPARGLVVPGEFIGIAEATGLIGDIGRLTLAESCRQMVTWQDRFGAAAPGVICVNVSSRQFADANLMGEIEAILDQTGLPASSLKLEITESAFMHDMPAAQETLTRAQSIGIEWSLDDFGTGYSSLSHLHRLQVDTIKVDRSFVSRIGEDPRGLEMVQAIVTLAHSLGMDVVAEGVETAEQLRQLQALGCEYAQGYYYSRPVDTVEADRLIGAQPWQRVVQHAGA